MVQLKKERRTRRKREEKSQREIQHEERLRLYEQGLTDTEIARLLNMAPDSIAYWRRRHNLPPVPRARKRIQEFGGGKHFREVLPPEQAEEMALFLAALFWTWERAIAMGIKPDVREFMDAWRDRPDMRSAAEDLREA